jgi:hypothetical protein
LGAFAKLEGLGERLPKQVRRIILTQKSTNERVAGPLGL